ncbi:MAG: V-type ATP synthase subunit I [Clostridiales bacterium]|nr:V-type ATP synthase subunit I [Clostridiales bacterium]
MAKLAMKKIELIASLEDSKAVVDLLQRRGTVEISDEQIDGLYFPETSQSLSQFDKYYAAAKQAKETLGRYASEQKSLMDSFSERKTLSVSEYLEKSSLTDGTLSVCFDINSAAKRIADEKLNIARLSTAADTVRPWISLDIPTGYTGTPTTAFFIGTLPKGYTREQVLEMLCTQLDGITEVEVQVLSAMKEQTCLVVACHRSVSGEVLQVLRDNGFARPSEPTKHPPHVRMERIEREIKQAQENIESSTELIKSYGDKHADINFLLDYLSLRKDKYDALKQIGMSRNVFILKGFIAERDVEALKTELESNYTVAVSVTDPDADEDIPVKLSNDAFAAPAESVTKMYSMPSKGDFDPTPIMSFFYYFFFGMMLSDAGYGLLMVIGILIALKKMKLEESTRKSLKMYLYCGISTVFWGAMYGSWFGDIINVIRTEFMGLEEIRLYIWKDPIGDLMTVMVACFGFGLVHLFTGVLIKAYGMWLGGDKFGAFSETVPVFATIAGAAPIFVNLFMDVPQSLQTIGKYVLIVGAVLVILTAGRSSKSVVG